MKVLFLVGIIACLQLLGRPAEAINCYVCNTIGCDDPFDTNDLAVSTIDCGSNGCLKSKTESLVVKSCATSTTGSDGCTKAEVLGISTEMCICTSDLCNSAHTVMTSCLTMLVPAFYLAVKLVFP